MNDPIEILSDAIEYSDPHPVIVYAARCLLTEYDREQLPDWVEALANSNPALWEDAIDEVRRLKAAEEAE